MKKSELINALRNIDDNAEICVVNDEQEICYDVVEIRTCEDKTSSYFRNYADLVIKI